MSRAVKWFSVLVALVVALTIGAGTAIANGAPVKVFLDYLPQFSNYGPANATGTATVSIGEAWVDVEAVGMPRLKDEQYEAWITNAVTDERVSLGKFNADASGKVEYHAEFDELPEGDYRYFYISVEPAPDPSPKADKRVTIAGVFPDAQVLIVSGTPTSTPKPGVTPSPVAPAVLPVTGSTGVAGWVLAGGLSLLIALALTILTALRRQRVRQVVAEVAEPTGPSASRRRHPQQGGEIDGGPR
jgi:hypothetical protein